MKSCFLLGHHDTPERIRGSLIAAVERHITAYGVAEFLVGHYGSFDRMAACVLAAAKEKHPDLTIRMLIPYHPGEHPVELFEGFDSSYYPFGMENVPRRYAIVRANRLAIQTSDFLICYDAGHIGNTRELVAYARRREKKGLIRIRCFDEFAIAAWPTQ